jgi:uncharacterized metal-binding protein YceD (DUF177 family)
MTDALLSRMLDPASVGSGELAIDVTASAEERDAIAKDLGLLGLQRLHASLTARAGSGGMIMVDGELDAELTQACVVSLKPVVQTIAEPIRRRFVPARRERPEPAIEIGADADDPPEPYDSTGIDLGAAVLEQFVLAVDPYPRADDAELPAPLEDDAEPGESPFSALKSLGHS